MTIEEIIVKEQEMSEIFQKTVDTHMVSEDLSLEELYCDDTEIIEEEIKKCKELADVHNQIANIMRKYQKIEQIIKDHDADRIPEDYWYIDRIREVIEMRMTEYEKERQKIILKPCPFCGGEARLKKHQNLQQVWYVQCNQCEIRTTSSAQAAFESWKSAMNYPVNQWNRRVEDGIAD